MSTLTLTQRKDIRDKTPKFEETMRNICEILGETWTLDEIDYPNIVGKLSDYMSDSPATMLVQFLQGFENNLKTFCQDSMNKVQIIFGKPN